MNIQDFEHKNYQVQISAYLDKWGMSITTFAEKAKVSPTTVSRTMAGDKVSRKVGLRFDRVLRGEDCSDLHPLVYQRKKIRNAKNNKADRANRVDSLKERIRFLNDCFVANLDLSEEDIWGYLKK